MISFMGGVLVVDVWPGKLKFLYTQSTLAISTPPTNTNHGFLPVAFLLTLTVLFVTFSLTFFLSVSSFFLNIFFRSFAPFYCFYLVLPLRLKVLCLPVTFHCCPGLHILSVRLHGTYLTCRRNKNTAAMVPAFQRYGWGMEKYQIPAAHLHESRRLGTPLTVTCAVLIKRRYQSTTAPLRWSRTVKKYLG